MWLALLAVVPPSILSSPLCSAMGKLGKSRPGQAKTKTGKGNGKGEARPPQKLKRAKVEPDGAPPPKVSKASFGENADINVKVQSWMGTILQNPIMGDKDHDIRNASPLEVSEGGKQSPLVVEDFNKALEGAEAGSKDGFYTAGAPSHPPHPTSTFAAPMHYFVYSASHQHCQCWARRYPWHCAISVISVQQTISKFDNGCFVG